MSNELVNANLSELDKRYLFNCVVFTCWDVVELFSNDFRINQMLLKLTYQICSLWQQYKGLSTHGNRSCTRLCTKISSQIYAHLFTLVRLIFTYHLKNLETKVLPFSCSCKACKTWPTWPRDPTRKKFSLHGVHGLDKFQHSNCNQDPN